MAKRSEVGPVLHEEHFRTLMLICDLDIRITGKSAARPFDPSTEEDRSLLDEVIDGLDELVAHNAFEEAMLMPRLRREGAAELAKLLVQEHTLINPLAARLRDLAFEILEDGMCGSRWTRFRYAARDLISVLTPHLQTEELAVVQRLGSLLDPEVDRALALQYASKSDDSKPIPDVRGAS